MIYTSWLAQVCAMLPHVRAAAVCGAGQSAALATWQAETCEALQCDEWSSLQQAARSQGSPLVSVCAPDESERLRIVFPLQRAPDKDLVVCVEIAATVRQQSALLQILQWADAWLGLLVSHSDHASTSAPHNTLWRCVAETLRGHDTRTAAYALCRELYEQLACEQVVCVQHGAQGARVLGLASHPEFDARSDYIQRLCALAQHAQQHSEGEFGRVPVQDAATVVPTPSGRKDAHASVWYYLPLHHTFDENRDWQAGILLSLPQTRPMTEPLAAQIDALRSALAAAIALQEKSVDSTPALLKTLLRRCDPLNAWRSKRRWPQVLLVLGCAVLLAGMWERPHRITAPLTIEALSQRAVVAPFDSFVASAERRAGETVNEGEILARLNDRMLLLEQQRWLSQQDEYEKQYRQALARREQAEANIFAAQLAQARAQLALVETRLSQTDLQSPITGVVVSGDLSRALGAPVQQGDVLFEVAPLRAYRAVLRFSERDLAFLAPQQTGALQLKAFPQQRWPITISRRAAVYQQDASDAWYRVEARLEGDATLLRPGMEGWGKITVGQRSVLWLLVHDLMDWWRLHVWRWWP